MPFWDALFGTLEDQMFDAIMNDNTKRLTALLDKGANPNHWEKDSQMSALSLAVQNGNAETVALLMERGAQVNKRDGTGELPLSFAVLNAALDGYVSPVVSLLLDNGANVSMHGKSGVKPLQVAATSGSESLVQTLLDHGAGVNSGEATGGFSPLMGAADRGHAAVVQTLLARGADQSLTDSLGQTALSLAEARGHSDCIEMLRIAAQNTPVEGFPAVSDETADAGVEDVRHSPDADGEIIFNLWYETDGFIIWSLRSKVYVASGTDDEILAFLQERANTDFRTADVHSVPEHMKTNVVLVGETKSADVGDECTHQMLELMGGYTALFREIIQSTPTHGFRLDTSQALMCVTGLIRGEDGELTVKIDRQQDHF